MDGLTDLQKAAMEAFSTEGFSAASMSKIGEAAGLRASSIYSHYRGKGALFLSLIAPAFDEETRYAVSVLNGRPISLCVPGSVFRRHSTSPGVSPP